MADLESGGRRPADPAWKVFEREVARGGPELQKALGIDSIELGYLRNGRHRPRFQDLPRISGALTGDPTHLARLMGMVPDAADQFREVIELQSGIVRVSERLRAREREAARARDDELSRLVSAVTESGEWAVAAWPGVEGPPECRIRDHDRIDIRHVDGRRSSHGQVYEALQEHLDPLGVQYGAVGPRWAMKRRPWDQPAVTTHWILPRLARETAPVLFTPLVTASVSVLSVSASARPEAVGAVLARVVGYGYTSAGIMVRKLRRGGAIDDVVHGMRREAHARWTERPVPRHVWAHAGLQHADQDALQLQRLAADGQMLLVWCREEDGVFEQKLGLPRPRQELEALRAARDQVDEALDRLPPDRVVRVDVRATSAPPNTAEAADQKMARSLDVVAEVLHEAVRRRFVLPTRLRTRFAELRDLDREHAQVADYLEQRVRPEGRLSP